MLTNRTIHRQQFGVSLIELMVGLTVGLIIIAAAGTMYVTNVRTGRDTLAAIKLNTEIRTAMDVMVDEIRRAGFSPTSTPQTNPFMDKTAGSSTDIRINGSGDCIEFSYDVNRNSAVDEEVFGFRISDEQIEMRTGGTALINNCDTGVWNQLTTPGIVTISQNGTTPYFSIQYQCLDTKANISDNNACISGGAVFDNASAGSATDLVETRTVTISIRGTSAINPEFTNSATQQVTVRNHRIVTVGS